MRSSILTLVALTSGCASIFSGRTQYVLLQPQHPDAQLLVDGQPVGKGPQRVSMKRDKPHLVTAQKLGCPDGIAGVTQNLNGLTVLNILWLPLAPIAVIVDVATGALWDLDETVYVPVDCRTPPPTRAAPPSSER